MSDWTARVAKRGVGMAPGQVQNASISGIYVETTLVLATGDHVLLEIQTDTAEGSRPILCEALIARKDTGPQPRHHRYGMQFTRIDDEALQKMLVLVAELWSLQQELSPP